MASRAPTIQDFGLERDRLEFFGRLMPPNYFGFLEHFLGPCQPTDADWQFYNIHKVMRNDSLRGAVPDDVDMTPWGDDDMECESDYGGDCDSEYGGGSSSSSSGAERVFIHSYAVSLARGAYVVLNAQLVDELPGRPGPRLTEMRLWEMIQDNWTAAAADADAGSAARQESTESRPGDGHSSAQPCPRLKYLGVKLIENQTSRGAIACEFDASLAGAPGAGLHLGGGGAGTWRERVVVTEDRSVAWTANPFTRCACRVAGGAAGVRAHLLREDASRGAVMDMFVELGLER